MPKRYIQVYGCNMPKFWKSSKVGIILQGTAHNKIKTALLKHLTELMWRMCAAVHRPSLPADLEPIRSKSAVRLKWFVKLKVPALEFTFSPSLTALRASSISASVDNTQTPSAEEQEQVNEIN